MWLKRTSSHTIDEEKNCDLPWDVSLNLDTYPIFVCEKNACNQANH